MCKLDVVLLINKFAFENAIGSIELFFNPSKREFEDLSLKGLA